MKADHLAELYQYYKLILRQKLTFCDLRILANRLPFLNIYINFFVYKFNSTKKCSFCEKDNDDL